MDNSADIYDANLCRHLKKAATVQPFDLAVAVQKYIKGSYQYQELNFAELETKSNKIAYALTEYGIKAGMKSVLMVTPSIEFFTLTFALFKAGIIPIIVDPGMGLKNLKQCFAEAQPDAFIGITKAHAARRLLGWGKKSIKLYVNVDSPIEAPSFRTAKSLLTGAVNLSSLLECYSPFEDTKPEFPINWLRADDMCSILFTSGSTGTPKGVVYSHRMFEAQIDALKNDYKIESGERDLATFPLFSLFGPALGMASIVPDMDASKPITANPTHLFAAINQYQCSNVFANPALMDKLGQAGEARQQKLPSVKRVISAGAPVSIEVIKRFSQMLNTEARVINSYGATESLPVSMFASDELIMTSSLTDSGAGICVGRPVSGVTVSIISITEDNIKTWSDGLALPANQIGEIVVSGQMVNQSYYRRENATLHSKVFDPTTKAMRHRMGDLGYFDDDGKLWMCGRKAHRVDSVIKRYYSIPCERIFNTHPSVRRSALVSVKINNTITPLVCIELEQSLACSHASVLYSELITLAEKFETTSGITDFLIHPDFPMDVRHNAKIFREKLSVWAQKKIG
ncbi:peptide synthase [Parashewanella spongiae]|uniref:Peptide synthase n=1 Tax=Parashewanella spongiae TaxID=342950 RepID=A0A3A6UCM5_9GAMM|nr:fatty acid CoA ligase family protein [Parashewanella spongiae]MCL1079986.1 AMP-binding protein [Parashewanella spongiae]RJY19409.1 peptide synthase [Parashewanella spongiae]